MKITVEEVKGIMLLWGIPVTPTEDPLIQHMIDKVTNHIKNETNQPSIPVGAKEIAIDMVIGEYLVLKYAMGTLDIPNIKVGSSVVAGIKDGDTDIKYSTAKSYDSPVGRFNAWVASLLNSRYDWGIWRRLRW